jgi:hypothetical protein
MEQAEYTEMNRRHFKLNHDLEVVEKQMAEWRRGMGLVRYETAKRTGQAMLIIGFILGGFFWYFISTLIF